MISLTVDSQPSSVASAIKAACGRIPPLWPLQHFVAVNPFVGLTHRSFGEACELLQRITGAAPLLPAKEYLELYRNGTITRENLREAAGTSWTVESLTAALESSEANEVAASLATVADFLDDERPRGRWAAFVAEEISKWCGVFFDDNQTTWRAPWQPGRLYLSWKEAALHDRNPEVYGLTGFRAFISTLPSDPLETINCCLGQFGLAANDVTDFLHRELMTIPGWAGFVQYLVREEALRGRESPLLKELLAVRLAYDGALFAAFGHDGFFRANWRNRSMRAAPSCSIEALCRWHYAYELGYQKQLALALVQSPVARAPGRPSCQAIFCIDVRSEVFRRALEAASPGLQTVGFAGFFGFAVAHRSKSAAHAVARCPVLLAPSLESCEPFGAVSFVQSASSLAAAGAWKAFQNSAASCFSFVETLGLGFGLALGKRTTAPSCQRSGAPEFVQADLATRVAMAEGALRNMSLTQSFARLILVCGHGSETANNPHASGLDCGACGGHAGDVNARLAASALNAPDVRAGLAARGIVLPDDTVFIAGLHNTTTDDVVLYDLEKVPASHAADTTALRAALTTAARTARQERAAALGVHARRADKIDRKIRARATDIAQLRPEWGLANNAAFVAAPRQRTAGLALRGRVFLHDYDAELDPDNQVLTLILRAPVVVASWINLQYYASRVDPPRYGAGNKVLHNVWGGIGVCEGNGGDLRVGLPLQSLHDGEKFVHEPRRLSVYLEAPRDRIQAVLAVQPAVEQLFSGNWIHLFAIEGGQVHRYTTEGWQLVATGFVNAVKREQI